MVHRSSGVFDGNLSAAQHSCRHDRPSGQTPPDMLRYSARVVGSIDRFEITDASVHLSAGVSFCSTHRKYFSALLPSDSHVLWV